MVRVTVETTAAPELVMLISELKPKSDLRFIERIIAPFEFDEARRDIVLDNFRKEIREIGSNRIILVGFIDGQEVVTGQLVLHDADEDPELADGVRIAHLHNLWVRRDLQGQGLARKMIATLEARAANDGFKIVTLGVDDTNTRAMRLYKFLDFEEFKRERGRTPDEALILMRKPLRLPAAQ